MSGRPEPRGPLATYFPAIAVAWLVVATVLFHTSPPDNNGDWTRLNIWLQLPEIVASWFDTTSVEEAEATGGVPSGLRYLPQRFVIFASTIFIWSPAFIIGTCIVDLLLYAGRKSVTGEDQSARIPLGCAVGTGLYATAVLATASAGFTGRLSIAAMLVASAIGLMSWKLKLYSFSINRKPERPATLSTSVMAAFIVLALAGASLPSYDFDVREYHLGGPSEFLERGRVGFLAHNVYTSFPFLTEMLSLEAMKEGVTELFTPAKEDRPATAKVVLCLFGLATAVCCHKIGTAIAGRAVGSLAALTYITAPWTHRLSTIAYVEGALNFFTAATVLCVVTSASGPMSTSPRRRFGMCLITGLTAGSAAACKYPGLVQVTIPAAVAIAVIQWRAVGVSPPVGLGPDSPSTGGLTPTARLVGFIKALVPFGLGVALTFGPWLIKNWVETGNPVYPLLYDVFGGRDWDAVLDAKWKAAHSPPHHNPLNFFTDLRGVFVGSDWQSGLMLAGVPLGLFALGKDPRRWGLLIFAVYLYVAWWALTHRIDRFWLPMMPILAVLAALGLSHERVPRVAARAVLGLNILYNFAFITTPLCGNNAFLADLPSLHKAILKFAPAIEAVNALPDDAVPLLVGEAATLEANKPVLYNTVFDRSLFVADVFGTEGSTAGEGVPLSAEEIRANFRRRGVTHVIVDWGEVVRYGTTYGFWEEVTPGLFDRLVTAGVLAEERVTAVMPAAERDSARRELLESWLGPLRNGQPVARVVVYEVADPD